MIDFRRLLRRLMAWIYFTRIRVTGAAVPLRGGTLFVALHRNGGIDVCVYETLLRNPVVVVDARWNRGIARAFIDGVALTRGATAGHRRSNDEALARCVESIRVGRDVLLFPEGTSSLGPRPLPVRSGAARILTACVERRIPVRVVPLGVHYSDAPGFRSSVEILVGESIETRVGPDDASNSPLHVFRRRIEDALHRVGTWFDDAETQATCESWAGLATMASPGSYVRCLRHLGEPRSALERTRLLALTAASRDRGACLHHGAPAPSPSRGLLGIVECLLLGPIVGLAALANAPPLLAAIAAARHRADDRNVVALWRLLVGVPALLLWMPVIFFTAFALAGPVVAALVPAATWLGIRTWDRLHATAAGLWNRLMLPDLEVRIRSARDQIRREMKP